MAENSKIEWCHHTANLWHGCTKVHAGCDHCYAETLSKRWNRDIWGNDKPRLQIESFWKDIKKFQELAAAAGEIHRVFVGSMMDIFEKPMPMVNSKGEPVMIDGEQMTTGHARQHFFNDIVPDTPNLLYLMLTKRPSNINKMIPGSWKKDPPKNVMFGTSPCDQETTKLIYQLLEVNGKRFLSVEPLLGDITLGHILKVCKHWKVNGGDPDVQGKHTWEKQAIVLADWEQPIDWIIVGGESGHHKRPMELEWARSLRDQCACAGIPFFMKQVDKIIPIPEDLMIREFPVTN